MAAPSVRNIASHRSLSELLSDFTDNGAQLVRDEIRLGRVEAVESLLTLRNGATWLGIGFGLGMCAAATSLACLIMVLSLYVLGGRTWLAALIVAVVLGVIAWICVWRGGSSLKGAAPARHETGTTIEETAEWLNHPRRSAVR
jgi:uncharacterized membrane protein YqjE